MKAEITNALIRCTGADQAAQAAFKLVRDDLDLWVRELPKDFDGIIADLSAIMPLLKKLRAGSSDYTLHLAATIDELHSLLLPSALIKLAGDCGFSIEFISTPS